MKLLVIVIKQSLQVQILKTNIVSFDEKSFKIINPDKDHSSYLPNTCQIECTNRQSDKNLQYD